jgi:hypothetical protein
MQNELAYKHVLDAERPVVAKTQEIISHRNAVAKYQPSKDKRFEHFYVDSLSHPTTSFTTFDSKDRVFKL